MPNALAYLRVSGRGQAADGKDGFDRQRISIQRYADRAHDTQDFLIGMSALLRFRRRR